LGDLLRFGIAIELADQSVAIFGGAFGQIVDEGFDLLSAGITQGGGSAVVGGIGLDEGSVEVVLADQQTEAVTEARLAVMMAVISVRGRLAMVGWTRSVGSGGPAKLLDRTEANAVSLAKGTVDGASFGDAHLGAVDQGRDVGGIGVSVADEAAGAGRFVDGSLKDPAAGVRVGHFLLKSSANSEAPPPKS
jgi:hypothetical protein